MKEKISKRDKVITFLNNNQFAKAIELMKLWNNEQLATFQCHYPQVYKKFISEEFNEFWASWRNDKLRLPGNPAFRFMAQPNIPDAEFVTGYLLFLLELKPGVNGKEDSDSDAGFKPTDSFSIHLMRHRLHQIYISLGQAKTEDLEKFAAVLYNLEGFAKIHRCPGYLLLANAYMQLATHHQRLMNEDQCKISFQLCWKYLNLADLSEKDSAASINNAFFGKGIILSNPFKIGSIAELKEYCRKAAEESLAPEHSKKLRDLAEETRPSFNM